MSVVYDFREPFTRKIGPIRPAPTLVLDIVLVILNINYSFGDFKRIYRTTKNIISARAQFFRGRGDVFDGIFPYRSGAYALNDPAIVV